jgi:hypothetical protein
MLFNKITYCFIILKICVIKKVKKLKVLELDKEVIKKLEEAPMNKIQGGGNFCPTGNRWTYCADGTCPSTYYAC